MGYIIVFVIMGTVFWYVINFTATFGWKVSWVWWYSGITAIFLQFAIVDPLISVLHYFIYRTHKKSGQWMLRVRSVTQAYNELFEVSEDEKTKSHPIRKTVETLVEDHAPNGALMNPDPENPPPVDNA